MGHQHFGIGVLAIVQHEGAATAKVRAIPGKLNAQLVAGQLAAQFQRMEIERSVRIEAAIAAPQQGFAGAARLHHRPA